ncbi:MAG: lipopolysaccharide biosynthesis protein [Desulfatibacillaceae bacterium]
MEEESAGARLRRTGVGGLGVRVASMAAQFLAAVVLARVLDADGYGVYAFAMAVVTVATIPAQTGLTNLAVRYTATYHVREEWGALRGLFATLPRWALAYGLSAAAVLLAATYWTKGLGAGAREIPALAWTCPVLVLTPLVALAGGFLRGLGQTVRGLIPELVYLPVGFLILVGAMAVFAEQWLTPGNAMAMRAAAATFAVAVGWAMLARQRPGGPAECRPEPRAREWFRTIMPLSFMGGMMIVNSQTDILMLGWFRDASEIGVYKAAVQGASLIAFVLTAMNTVLAPHLARLYATGEMSGLRELVTKSARVSLAGALPAAIVFWLFGDSLLGWVFGPEFRSGYVPLAVLCLGQVVNASAGSVGFLLNMSGHERDTAMGVTVAAVSNIVLNGVLIPMYGMPGAAMATASSMVLWNVLLVFLARRRTGLDSTFLGLDRSGVKYHDENA